MEFFISQTGYSRLHATYYKHGYKIEYHAIQLKQIGQIPMLRRVCLLNPVASHQAPNGIDGESYLEPTNYLELLFSAGLLDSCETAFHVYSELVCENTRV